MCPNIPEHLSSKLSRPCMYCTILLWSFLKSLSKNHGCSKRNNISDDWETWEQISQKLIFWWHGIEAHWCSWDSSRLCMALVQDLSHSMSAQSFWWFLFCFASFPFLYFILLCLQICTCMFSMKVSYFSL